MAKVIQLTFSYCDTWLSNTYASETGTCTMVDGHKWKTRNQNL